ncbi:MAG: hypothetical protein R6U91_06075 [Bacillota bacterium]
MPLEMDLRSREFIAENRPFRLGPALIISLIIFLILPLLIPFLVDTYSESLRAKITEEKAVLTELKKEASPLDQQSQKAASLKEEQRLIKRFAKENRPVTELYLLILTKAETNNLTINKIDTPTDGQIVLSGNTETVKNAALFNLAITKHPKIITAAVSSLEKDKEKGYAFKIEGSYDTNENLHESGNQSLTGQGGTLDE